MRSDFNLKDAFGKTPDSVQHLVVNTLRTDERSISMKKTSVKVLFAAAVIAVLTMTAALAASRLGVLNFFTNPEEGQVNELAAQGVQTVEQENTGASVRVTMNDAIYDPVGKTYALSWTMENLTGQEDLYIVCDGVFFDGEPSYARTYSNMTAFFLPAEGAEGGVSGSLPDNASADCTLTFTILRPLGEVQPFRWDESEEREDGLARLHALWDAHIIPQEGDGVLLVPGMFEEDERAYSQSLMESGLFEQVDTLPLSFTLSPDVMQYQKKTLKAPLSFAFADYELRVPRAEMTATTLSLDVEYITKEAPKDGGKYFGPLWQIVVSAPDGKAFYTAAGGSWEDPVQMEDGRFLSVYHFDARGLSAQPEALTLTLATFDEDLKETLHAEDAVSVPLE